MTQPVITQYCFTSGLANRLRAWIGIGALADCFGLSFYITWRRATACRATFTDMFVPDTCTEVSLETLRKLPSVLQFTGNHGKFTAIRPARMYAPFAQNQEAFEAACTARRNSIKLQPQHAELLEAFLATLPAGCIGVHVRRTDLPKHAQKDARLLASMDAELATNPTATFVLCSDNPDSYRALTQRYGERLYWRDKHMKERPKGTRGENRCTSMADAAIDLFTLSRTSKIIGTYGSSFTKLAAGIGNISYIDS